MRQDRFYYDRVYGENGFGERVFDFVSAHELVILNTYFRMIEEHYITYESKEEKSQINF